MAEKDKDKAAEKALEKQQVEKDKALELAILQIEKQFGKGSIMRLGEDSARINVEVIPTGAITLDWALGVGGGPARPGHRNLRA